MERVKLTDICNPKQWKTIPIGELLEEGYPVYGANGVIGYYSEYNHEEPVVAVTCRGATCGSVNITTAKSYVTGNAMCLDDVRDDIERDYLYYNLLHYDFNKVISGSAQPQITRQGLEKVEIYVCPHDEQYDVVKILRKCEKIIKLRNDEMTLIDSLIKARFVEMFGNPSSNPYGFQKVSVQDAIDSGYIEKPLDGNHGNKHPKASEYVEDGVPFIMANDIIDGKVDFDNCAKLTRDRADKLDKGFAHNGDVLITHKGTIGRTAILYTDYDYVMLTPQVTYYRPIRGLIAEYLKGYFDSDCFQNEMKLLAAAGGSTRAYVGITNQTKMSLLIPDMERQNEYKDFVQQVDKSKYAA